VGEIASRAAGVYRDFQIDGVPASGPNDPAKAEIRALFRAVEQLVGGVAAGLKFYATRALLNADTTQPLGTLAYVYDDAVVANNTVYHYEAGGWVVDDAYFEGVASVVQPIIDQGVNEAKAAAGRAETVGQSFGGFATAISRSAAIDRKTMFQQARIDDAFSANTFGGLTYVALGSQLPDTLNSFQIYISTASTSAASLSVTLYSRPIAGAADDGGGHAGDVVEFAERRSLDTLVKSFARNGTINRVVFDSLRDVTPDAARMYLLVVHVLDAAGAFVPFGTARATSPASSAPGYPQIRGYRQDSTSDLIWRGADSVCFAILWRSVRFASESETAAKLAAISAGPRIFTIGAPLSLLSATTNVAAAGTWYNQYPAVQTGLVTKLRCQSSGVNAVTFVFSRLREDNSGFDDIISLTFQTKAGANEFIAGRDFDPFIVPEGTYMGVKQAAPLIVYSALGNDFYLAPDGTFTPNAGVTVSFSAVIVAENQIQTVAATKDARVVLYDVKFDKTSAPLGWSRTAGVTYTADGMALAQSTASNSWQIGNYSHHWLACDDMVLRVEYKWTTPGSIIGIGAAPDPQGPTEKDTSLNSLFAIDGTASAPRAFQTPSNFMTNPDGVLVGPNGLGFVPKVGDIITSEVKLDWGRSTHNVYNQNQAAMADTTVAGENQAPTDFGGPGLMLPYVAVHYKKGNVLTRRITILYDGPSPDIFVAGDSLSKGALSDATVRESYVGRLQADGYQVMRCTVPGWTSHGIRKAAMNMMRQARPRRVLIAAGTNDYNQGVPVADFKWNVASMIDEARRAGAVRIALAILHPIPDPSNANGSLRGLDPYNAALLELAAAQPDLLLVRWDRALTVNADGVTPDTTKLNADRQHPIAKGGLAQYNALRYGAAAEFLD
jgi:lysophospholipase L1-like esterase